jgi:hypothetical protein
MNDSVRKLLPDGPLWSLMYCLSSFGTAVIAGVELLPKLASPYLRWITLLCLAVVLWRLYWTGHNTTGRILDQYGKSIEIAVESKVLCWIALVVTFALPSDFIITVFAWSRIAEASRPEFYAGKAEYVFSGLPSIAYPSQNSHLLDGYYYTTTNSLGEIDVDLINNSHYPHFTFFVKKAAHVDELVIEDVQIVVHRVESSDIGGVVGRVPTSFKHNEDVDRVIIAVKRNGNKLVNPIVCSASKILDSSRPGKLIEWRASQVVVRDNFLRKLSVFPVFEESGMYEISANLVVRSSISTTQTISLFQHNVTFVVMPMVSTSEDSSPAGYDREPAWQDSIPIPADNRSDTLFPSLLES